MNNKTIVKEAFEKIWNEGNLELIEKYYSTDFAAHYPDGDWEKGHKGVLSIVKMMRESFPDYKETIHHLIESGEWVTVRIMISGANIGHNPDFLPKPTGKKVNFQEIIICKVEDGKLIEQWGSPDIFTMRQQLGLL
jgi:predicted ester cyclase